LETELQSVQDALLLKSVEHNTVAQQLQETQNELSRLQDQLQQAWTDQQDAAGLRQSLSAARLDVDQLRAQVQSLQARAAGAERLQPERIAQDAAKSEKDRLAGELETVTKEAAELRAKVAELQGSLSETAKTDLNSQAQLRKLEQQLAEERSGVEGLLRRFRQELEAAKRAHEQGSASLLSAVEQLHREVDGLRQERDGFLDQINVLTSERNQLAAERDGREAHHKEAVERFQADLASLNQACQESRQQEASVAKQKEELAVQLENLRAEVEQQCRLVNEHEQTVATLQHAVEIARAEAVAERNRCNSVLADERARAEAEQQKSQEALAAAQRRFDEYSESLQSAAKRLHGELIAFQEAVDNVGVGARVQFSSS
jgi:chromosome segregation ATPase